MSSYKIARYASPLGPITMASDGSSLIGLWFDGQKHERANLPDFIVENSELEVFRQTALWLDKYFAGELPDFTPPLLLTGSPFKQQVAEILLSIPAGCTLTYGDIAAEISRLTGKKMSAQAVGQAVGRNCISIIVPCHRVVGARGQLTGYAGGLDRKLWLLRHESAMAL